MTDHSPETVALARMAGARVARVLVPFRQVPGRAISRTVARALVSLAADEDAPAGGFRAFASMADGSPCGLLDGRTAIVVWVTMDPSATIDGETCPSCGAVLVWGAGPSCPNDCPEVDR